MKKIISVIVILCALLLFTSAKVYKDDIFALSWSIEKEMLSINIEAKTLGWVAFGIDPSMMMKDADFIIAYVKEGALYISDQFGTGVTSHKEDISFGGTQDIISSNGYEKDGKTIINFTLKLNSNDKYDKKLLPNKEYTVLLAIGDKDNFTSIHTKRLKIKITL